VGVGPDEGVGKREQAAVDLAGLDDAREVLEVARIAASSRS
jgi:hypothetical protein